jgi:renalase
MERADLIVIGAGMTGLAAAKIALEGAPERRIVILEKSAGVGGRLATRRSPPAIFDHGAQTYPVMASGIWHEFWKRSGRIDEWTDSEGVRVGSSRAGMTDLAKHLSQDLEIRKNTKVVRLARSTDSWNVISETGEQWESTRVLITAPVPQSLELLKSSRISHASGLSHLVYDPALVLLLGLESSPSGSSPFIPPKHPPILSVTDQEQKKVSGTAAWTVVFDPEFSTRYFESDEIQVKTLALREIRTQFPDLNIRDAQLKKWRYSRPRQIWPESAHLIEGNQGLVLAGDAFGGNGIDGALRSAKAAITLLFLS